MSCLTNPVLCQASEYRLRGPIAQPPSSGWRIIELPWQAKHLQDAWASSQMEPIDSSKAAWGYLMSFLRANSIQVPFAQIVEESIRQWCEPDPSRCMQYTREKLPWARKRWELANQLLLSPADPHAALVLIVADLTERINGPEGCVLCAEHWAQLLETSPIPENPTLDEARHWLVDRHNETRENKVPASFNEIARKFWT